VRQAGGTIAVKHDDATLFTVVLPTGKPGGVEVSA
jgi:hypothetical protein